MCLLPRGLKFAFSMPLLLKEAANTPLTYVSDPVTSLNRKCVVRFREYRGFLIIVAQFVAFIIVFSVPKSTSTFFRSPLYSL